MDAKIEGKKLHLILDIEEHQSKTGKSLVIASTNGNLATNITHKGKPVIVGVNAYIKN